LRILEETAWQAGEEYIGALPLARDMLSAGEEYRGKAKICHELGKSTEACTHYLSMIVPPSKA